MYANKQAESEFVHEAS